MLQNITLGQFFPGNSILHRLDPRTKIILLFALMILIFAAEGWAAYLAFPVEGAAAYRLKIRQAAQLDNFIYVADSLREPRRRSFGKILRVQSDAGGNNLRRVDKLAAGAFNLPVEFADVHDLAAKINRRDRKTFIAAEKNRCAESRIGNDDDNRDTLYPDAD